MPIRETTENKIGKLKVGTAERGSNDPPPPPMQPRLGRLASGSGGWGPVGQTTNKPIPEGRKSFFLLHASLVVG